MSFILCVYTHEGIVLTADSRVNFYRFEAIDEKTTQTTLISSTDHAKKLFLLPNDIGLLTCEPSDTTGVPFTNFIESFIHEKLSDQLLAPEHVGRELLDFYRSREITSTTQFYVAGYERLKDRKVRQIIHIDPVSVTMKMVNAGRQYGWYASGDVDILERLLMNVATIEIDEFEIEGNTYNSLPFYEIPFEFFTLQDAIEFSLFCAETTRDIIRFQKRDKTVGGPIDILAITPDKAKWISKKEII